MLQIGDLVRGTWTDPRHALTGMVVGYGMITESTKIGSGGELCTRYDPTETHLAYLVQLAERIEQPEPYRAIRVVVLRADRVEKV